MFLENFLGHNISIMFVADFVDESFAPVGTHEFWLTDNFKDVIRIDDFLTKAETGDQLLQFSKALSALI